jgi:Carboxypeptidase regulatory-like domain
MQTAVTVEGRIIEERTGEPVAHVSVVLFGGSRPTSAGTDTTGTYRLTGVPPGTYTLDVDPSRVRHVFTRITVGNQPLHVPDLRTHAKIEIRGRIEPRGWQHLMVTAYPKGGGVSVFDDGTFLLRLEEGEYRLGLNIPKTHAVKSMTFGSRDLMKNPLLIQKPTQQQIRIVLAAK